MVKLFWAMLDSGWEPYYVLKLYYKTCLPFIEIDALEVYKYQVNGSLESHFIHTRFIVVKGLVLDQPRSWYRSLISHVDLSKLLASQSHC